MNDKKTVSFGMALAIIFLPILVILLGGLVLRVGFLVPLMLATITASLLSIMAGFTWKEVEACIVNGVHRIIIVTCILFLVGTLIGVWIQAGVIPLFLYWGLKLLSPSMFLVSTVLICAVFSLMTGTSFGTIGTAGLALLGVGEALGFPTGLTAGAIVSGAYFGDKMSPVSDTTNLASGITGTNIFSHIGSMLYTTVPATLVALGLYWYLGLNYSGGAMPDLTPITDALNLQAMKLVGANIRQAYANGKNAAARDAMMYASALAGMGFGNTQNGIIHAIGTTLPVECHIPHGLAMSFCAPFSVGFNYIANPEKYAIVADILRGDDRSGCMSVMDRAADVEDAFRDLLNDLDIATGLSNYGVKREDLPACADRAFAAKRLLNNNPRAASRDQILALLEANFEA